MKNLKQLRAEAALLVASAFESGYKSGLNDAWNAARIIDTDRDAEDYVFGDDLEHGFMNITPREAIERLTKYQEERSKK